MAADEAGALALVTDTLRRVVRPAIEENGGQIIKTTGDGVLASFPSAVGAVRSALMIQSGGASDDDSDGRLTYRVGVHVADIVLQDGDIFGDGVNVAARLQGLAEPGGICVSSRVQEDTQGRLQVTFEDLGPQQLKNIPRAVRAFRVGPQVGAPAPLAKPPRTGRAKPSILVLPFENRTGDPGQEYFADAITEDLVTALSRWRWFFVIGRNSSFALKGRKVEPEQLRQDLGVRYLLQGSVRKSGERVRVSAHLVDAEAGASVWAENYDRELLDILALQDEMVEQVVGAIEPAMLHTEGARTTRKNLADYDALDCFQRGMWHLNKVSEEGCRVAASFFRQSIERDPELALGHIGLARTLYGAAVYGWSPRPDADLAQALAEAQTAIRLDPRDAHGYFAASGAALFLGRHREALDHAQKTLRLNPNLAFGHFRLGQVLVYAGRPGEAVHPIERSLRYSPYDPQQGPMLTLLALAHFHLHAYEEAVRHAEAAVDRMDRGAAGVLAASLARLGRVDEARRAFPTELQMAGQIRTRLAPYARASDRDDFLEGLSAASAGELPLELG